MSKRAHEDQYPIKYLMRELADKPRGDKPRERDKPRTDKPRGM